MPDSPPTEALVLGHPRPVGRRQVVHDPPPLDSVPRATRPDTARLQAPPLQRAAPLHRPIFRGFRTLSRLRWLWDRLSTGRPAQRWAMSQSADPPTSHANSRFELRTRRVTLGLRSAAPVFGLVISTLRCQPRGVAAPDREGSGGLRYGSEPALAQDGRNF
jgi:hypothetical protein